MIPVRLMHCDAGVRLEFVEYANGTALQGVMFTPGAHMRAVEISKQSWVGLRPVVQPGLRQTGVSGLSCIIAFALLLKSQLFSF